MALCLPPPSLSRPPLQVDSPLNAFDETEEDAATLEGGEEQAQAITTEGDTGYPAEGGAASPTAAHAAAQPDHQTHHPSVHEGWVLALALVSEIPLFRRVNSHLSRKVPHLVPPFSTLEEPNRRRSNAMQDYIHAYYMMLKFTYSINELEYMKV